MEDRLYEKFFEIEERHWWFVARRQIISDLIGRRIQLPSHAKVLDVGCGTGAVLQKLAERFDVYGTDPSPVATRLCCQRGLENIFTCTLETFPHPELRFDLVTLLDVIEHVDDDRDLLSQAHRLLTRGGHVLVTVPAYQFLWSKHDEINHHKRRYVKPQLRKVLEQAGFGLRFLSYFNTILFPAALLQRLSARLLGSDPGDPLEVPPHLLNGLLTRSFESEKHLLRRFSLPFGLSVIAIADKT